jgi:selT/selW/selH-like putative selenoprotein
VRLADDLLGSWAPIFAGVRLKSSTSGRFEVFLDGKLMFSKASLGRHPEKGEIAKLFEAKLGPPLEWRKPS